MLILLMFNISKSLSCSDMMISQNAEIKVLEPHLQSLYKYKLIKGKISKEGLLESTQFNLNTDFSSSKTVFTLSLPEIKITETDSEKL